MKGTWPLVGRDEELGFVRERLEGTAGRGAVLAGEAGCGKTRLATELFEHARSTGWASVLVIAHQATSAIQLGAFAPLLEAQDLPTEDPLKLLVQAHGALQDLRGDDRMLLVVDDAQHLDPLSATLVHRAASAGISVLVTLRIPSPVPEPVATLWKEGLADRIELQPLAWPDTRELLERVLDGEIEGGTMRRLWSASRGNVMYLRELVTGGLATAALRERDGTWSWEGDVIAPGLVDLVASRLSHIPAPQAEILRLLAVCEPVRAEPLGRLVDDGELADLERAGLVAAREQGGALVVRLAHPLYGEVLRERMSPLDARATKHRIVETFRDAEGLGTRERTNLARWSIELGQRSDPELLTHAAFSTPDPVVAEDLARAAVEAGGDHRAHRALHFSLMRLGRHDEAEAVIANAPSPGDDRSVVSLASTRAFNLYYGLGREAQALEVLTEAEGADQSPELAAHLRTQRAGIALNSGRVTEAAALVTDVLDDAGLLRRDPTLVPIANGLRGYIYGVQGRLGDALAATDLGMDALGSEPDRGFYWNMLQLSSARYLAYWLTGHLDEADELARSAYELFADNPAPEYQGMAALGLGRVALSRGQASTAARRLDEACTLLREADPGSYLLLALGGLAQARALLGEVKQAEVALDEIEARHKAVRMFDVDASLARAWTAAAAGSLDRGAELSLEAADLAAGMGHPASEVIGLHDALRLGAGVEVAERLLERAPSIEGPAARAREDHAMAVLSGVPEPIERACETFEGMGALLLAAECAAQAAHLYATAGNPRRAREPTARAQALVAQCEGARTPLLLRAGQGARLTAREREIAELAARGRSNQDIADQLVVSVRTVENHLHQVYVKLGVDGRSGLEAALEVGTTVT